MQPGEGQVPPFATMMPPAAQQQPPFVPMMPSAAPQMMYPNPPMMQQVPMQQMPQAPVQPAQPMMMQPMPAAVQLAPDGSVMPQVPLWARPCVHLASQVYLCTRTSAFLLTLAATLVPQAASDTPWVEEPKIKDVEGGDAIGEVCLDLLLRNTTCGRAALLAHTEDDQVTEHPPS